MILTDREIQIAIQRELIKIDPRPVGEAYSSTSVDLTLDPNLSIFKSQTKGLEVVIDPSIDDFNAETLLANLTDNNDITTNGYTLYPGKLILGYTIEKLDLRQDTRVAARVEGKSSLARIGLSVHQTAPVIHAGFRGRVRLEIVNHGHLPIKLTKGMRICQLIFELTLGTPAKAYNGQYIDQTPKA